MSKKFEYKLSNGKTLTLEGDEQPSDEEVESIAAEQKVQLQPLEEIPINEPVTKSVIEKPISREESIKEPGLIKKGWDLANKPLFDVGPQTRKFAESIDNPTSDEPSRIPFTGGATWKGLGAGLLEGLGDATSSLTSPLNLATMLATGGSAGLASRGIKTGVKGLHQIGQALSVPVVAHGGREVVRPDATLSERFMGATEIAGGIAGLRSKLPAVADSIKNPAAKLLMKDDSIKQPRTSSDKLLDKAQNRPVKPTSARTQELVDKAQKGILTPEELIEVRRINPKIDNVPQPILDDAGNPVAPGQQLMERRQTKRELTPEQKSYRNASEKFNMGRPHPEDIGYVDDIDQSNQLMNDEGGIQSSTEGIDPYLNRGDAELNRVKEFRRANMAALEAESGIIPRSTGLNRIGDDIVNSNTDLVPFNQGLDRPTPVLTPEILTPDQYTHFGTETNSQFGNTKRVEKTRNVDPEWRASMRENWGEMTEPEINRYIELNSIMNSSSATPELHEEFLALREKRPGANSQPDNYLLGQQAEQTRLYNVANNTKLLPSEYAELSKKQELPESFQQFTEPLTPEQTSFKKSKQQSDWEYEKESLNVENRNKGQLEIIEQTPNQTGEMNVKDIIRLGEPGRIGTIAKNERELIEELKKSIQENGIAEPIIIRKTDNNRGYEIEDGHHRVQAARELGIENIPIKIGQKGDQSSNFNKSIKPEQIIKKESVPNQKQLNEEALAKRRQQSKSNLPNVRLVKDLYETPVQGTHSNLATIASKDRIAIDKLKLDIQNNGLKEPIELNKARDGGLTIGNGRHRIIALQELGIKDAPVIYRDATTGSLMDKPARQSLFESETGAIGDLSQTGGNISPPIIPPNSSGIPPSGSIPPKKVDPRTQALLDLNKNNRAAQAIKMAPPKEKESLIRKALDFNRTLLTAYDLSAPGRQGLPLIGRKEWWTSLDDMFKAWGSEKAYNNIQESIIAHPSGLFQHTLTAEGKRVPSYAQRVGLSLTNLLSQNEEVFRSKLAEKIPGVRPSNRAFVGYLNKLRSDTFANMMDLAKKQGKDPENDLVLGKQIADFINNATGRGHLGSLEPVVKQLSDVFFAPRLMASRIRTYTSVLNPKTYTTLDPMVRKETLKSLFAVAGTGTLIGELSRMAGAQVSNDPTNSDFRKIKIGNSRLDPFGGFQQYPVAAARLLSGQSTSSMSGKTTDLTAGRFGQQNRASVVSNFFKNKLAPVPSFVWSWMEGKEFDGETFDAKKAMLARTVPILLQDIESLYEEDPSFIPIELINKIQQDPSKLPLAVPSAFGMGVQTYGR